MAEKVPTWRWDSRGVRRWFGKPVTGYHLCLVTLILLFVHVPQLYAPSWEREADLLAMFFLLTVTWDFLRFACNRHFGVGRFRKGQIWWFPAWTLGVPRPYLLVIVLSLCTGLAPALWTGAWVDRARHWSMVFCELLALTVITARRRSSPSRSRERDLPLRLRQVEPAPKLADGPLAAGARRLVLVAEDHSLRSPLRARHELRQARLEGVGGISDELAEIGNDPMGRRLAPVDITIGVYRVP